MGFMAADRDQDIELACGAERSCDADWDVIAKDFNDLADKVGA